MPDHPPSTTPEGHDAAPAPDPDLSLPPGDYVRFTDVGRNKLSWTERCAARTSSILKAVKKRGALMSRDVDAVLDEDDGAKGTIIVGGFREVGRFEAFRIVAPSEART